MASESNSQGGGIGFVGLLTILFIGLKLTGYITWSWWWVLAPVWVSAAIVGLIVLACGLAIAALAILGK
jgi:hypothetical protein